MADLDSERPFEFQRLEDEEEQPLTKTDVDYERWRLDAKARALTALCTLHSQGKGTDLTQKALHAIAAQIANL